MEKIQKLSRIFKWLLIILLCLGPIANLLTWYFPSFHPFFDLRFFPSQANVLPSALSLQDRTYGFILGLLPTACGVLILYYLAALFNYYEQGKIFDYENTRCLKMAAYFILFWEIVRPIYDVVFIYIFQTYLPKNITLFTFDITNLRGIIVAVLLYVIAWVMQEAHLLQQENQYTI